jgi:chlorite dismutase
VNIYLSKNSGSFFLKIIFDILKKKNKDMSATWYECKVKYRKIDENGIQKITTEPYLVDALSYTEAEKRMNEEMSAYVSEEFKITNIKVANYAEIHPFEKADRWFRSKVSLIAYDEESGKERKSNMYLLIQANDVKEAYDNTIYAMKNTMGDYTVPAISESAIMDVFPYFSGEEGDLEKLEKFNLVKGSKIEAEAMEDPLDIEEVNSEVVVEEVIEE